MDSNQNNNNSATYTAPTQQTQYNSPTQNKGSNKNLFIILGAVFGVLLLLCACYTTFFIIADDGEDNDDNRIEDRRDDDEDEEEDEVSQNDPTPTPTEMASPTPTTFVNIPTTEPETQDLSSNEIQYITEITTITLDMSDEMEDFGQFNIDNSNPSLWTDEEREYVFETTYLLEGYYDEFRSITPPAKYSEAHSLYLEGTSKLADAMQTYREAIEENDPTKAFEAADLIREISEPFAEANKLLAQ